MATINRKKLKFVKPKLSTDNQSAQYYNSLGWKRLRNSYLLDHPICEVCLKNGIVTPAEDIHHIKEFLSGRNEEERWKLLLNPNNLMAVCSDCHYKIHKERRYGNH